MKPVSVPRPGGRDSGRLLAAILLAALLPALPGRAADSWQAWIDQSVSAEIAEGETLRAAQSFQHDLDRGSLATYYVEAGLVGQARSWLDLGLHFHRQYDRRDGRWVEENRPFGDVTFKWKFRRVSFSDRNRIEFRFREDQDDAVRFRNKATLHYAGWERDLGLKPYAAIEVFVDDSAQLRERNRTRTTLGLQAVPSRIPLPAALSWPAWASALGVDGYVTRQRTKKADDWADEFIAGLQFNLKL